MKDTFDVHLSAYRISPMTIRKVEALGFRRDEFANNTRCDTTVYHGTLRDGRALPDEALWNELKGVFSADESFVGGLEEEAFVPAEVVQLNGTSLEAPRICRPLGTCRPAVGEYKACDIHINIDLSRTSNAALEYIEALELASFDRPDDNEIHRIFSATCESVGSGRKLFSELSTLLCRVPGLVGKMKFERTTRFLRQPADAPALPLTSDAQLAAWLAQTDAGT